MSKSTPTIRCAIYTRKSTEEGLEQEFNSLDAQRQAGEAFIESQRSEGWQCIGKRYDDGGYTGGNMDRPALTELMADVRSRRIDCVVVYKVDRLSRSLLDFAKLINAFDEHQVSFVSVTQHFNTTTSMGRLTLNILLSFAQFEREIIGERIRDKILATARQGKYFGGFPILGLDIVDRRFVVNQAEVPSVRHIFDLYLKLQSCRKVAEALNAEGITTKRYTGKSGKPRGGKPWEQKAVYSLLTNRKLIGQITHRGKSYPAEHEAIVSAEVFERAQGTLTANQTYTHKHQVRRFALLRRMIHCGHCGSLVQPGFARNHGREYRYYACAKKVRTGYGKCPLPCVPAGEIETAVIDQLRALLRHGDVIARTYREVREASDAPPDPARQARLDDLRKRHEQTRRAIRAVLNVGDGDEQGVMAEELKRLNGELKALERAIGEMEAAPAPDGSLDLGRVTKALQAIDPVWDVLYPQEQQRIVSLLVEDITVSTGGIDIRFRTNGIEQVVEELQSVEEARNG